VFDSDAPGVTGAVAVVLGDGECEPDDDTDGAAVLEAELVMDAVPVGVLVGGAVALAVRDADDVGVAVFDGDGVREPLGVLEELG
jgi:hypothetical protein